MQSVYLAAGGDDGLLRLAEAWHSRVMADEVVSHAFSHGFHPQHSGRLAAYWAEALGGPAAFSGQYGTRRLLFAFTAATARTKRWTAGLSPASTGHWRTWG